MKQIKFANKVTMAREEQIKLFANSLGYPEGSFGYELIVKAVKWADSHPKWYDAQGDNVPEYGREVIVIRRNGMICYGHRPNPKEYVIVEGKKCFAKTYDKNDWNIPYIALWLDVEIPDELIEQITDKWFEEQKQQPRKED